ncbi:MAG: sulfate adenylyltransferase subunit CysN [Bacteroidales bacterium]|nr:sulfate adenylyltransferase subunit CysN [Candidatus Equimonas faecalis]
MATTNISEYLDQDERKDLLRFLTAGSVDDGKSTLIGRLLFDSKKLYEDQLSALQRDSARVGNAGAGEIDYALLLDGLKAEREQGITIDVAYRYFSTNRRKFIIADTPGHEQYTRNMITGGSTANLAVILVDARTGVITQTRRHSFLVSLLGIKHVVLAVNKMDLVDFSKATFDSIVADYKAFVQPLGIPDVRCIPLSAKHGDNVVEHSAHTPWYDGPTMLQYLETVETGHDHNLTDFRFPVQYVLRPNLDFRGFCGKVASGIIRRGDRVRALPSGKESRIKSIVTYDGTLDYAFPPQSVTLQLEDEIDISRGEMIVKADGTQPRQSRKFEATLVWMDEEAMDASKDYYIKQATCTTRCHIDGIDYRVDVNTMAHHPADRLLLNEIGRVRFATQKPLIFDAYQDNKPTGSFVLIDPLTNNTAAVGMIREALADDAAALGDIYPLTEMLPRAAHEELLGQRGQLLWLTGLSGAGKSTVALAVERELHRRGRLCRLLDGDNVRAGINKGLGFSSDDRRENIRRVAEVGRLFVDTGIITLCSFVSPTRELREMARQIVGPADFKEIYVSTPLEVCEKRDVKGLYARARRGEVEEFTGVSAPFEAPEHPALTLDTSRLTVDECVSQILNII